MPTPHSNILKGYLLGAIAAITYGMNPLFTLPLYSDGMDACSVLFFRYLFGAITIGIMLLIRQPQETNADGHLSVRQPLTHPFAIFKIESRYLLPLFGLGISMGVSSLTLFVSYNYMDAGIASTLLFVYPIMVAVAMTLLFHERMTLRTVFCILTTTAGIFLLYKQSDGATLSLIGTVIVLVSALTYAIYLIGINRHGLNHIPTLKITFYLLLFALLVYIAGIAYNGYLTVPSAEKWYLWFNLIALGLLPTVVSFTCSTIAIQHIGSTPVAILGALEPVTAVLIGITLFSERLTLREVSGIMLIITAVGLIVAGGSISNPLTRFRKLFPKSRCK